MKKYLSLKKIATAAIFSVLFYNSLFEVIIPLHDKTTISIQSSQEKNIASLNHEVWISKIKLNGKNLDLSLISLPSNGWLYNGNIVAVVQDIPLQLEIASKNAEIHFLTTQYSGIVSLNDADSVEEIDLYSEKNVPAIYTVKESFVSYDSMQLFLYKTLIGLSLFIYSLFFVLFLPTSSFLRGLALPLLFWNSIKLIQTNIPSAWYLVLLLLFFIISLYTLRKKGPFIKLVRSDKSFFSPLAICLINLFVTYSLFAESLFFSNGILIYTLSNLSFLISFCLFLVLIEVFIYNIFFKTINKYIYSSSITPSRKEVLKLASTVFIILVTIWGVYLYGYFPANMSADSYVQYFQATGEWPLDDWHPIYHTLFLRLILNLWKHPAAISLFQIAFLASIITLLLSHFYKKGIHAGIIIRIALLIGILPSNGISIVTLWKDYPFTTALLWLTYVFIRYLDNPKQFNHSISLNIQLFVASLCTAFFRHNGILVFFTVSLFFLLSSLRNKRYWLLLNAILMTFTVVFFQGPLLNHLDVIKTSKPARYIAPLHDIYGVYEAGYEITDDAENALFSEVPKQYWVDNYNPYTAATIMFGNDYRYIDSLSSFSSLDIIKIYLKNFLRHPIPVIYNRLRSSSLLWYIIQPSDGYSFRYSTSIDKNIDIGVNKAANTITRILNNYLLFSHSNILLDVLFWRPAILLFILLFLAVSFADAFSKQVFIILIPLLSNLITLLFSMSFQDFRYGYFITLLTPFVIVSFVITAKNTIALKKTVALSKKEVTIGYTDGKKQTSNDRLEKKPTMGINEKKEVGVIIHGCSLSIILLSLTLISNFQYLSEFFYFSIFIVYIIAYYFLTGVSPLKNKEYIFFLLLAFSSPVIVNSFSSASLHYQEILNVLWKLSLAFLVIQLSEIHSNKKSNTHLPKSKSVDESIIAIYLSIISAIVIDNSMHEFQYIENLITRIAGVCTASILLFPFWLTLIHTTGLLLDYLHSDHSISNGDKFYNYYPIPIKMSSYSINNSDSPSRRKKMFYLVLSSIIALFVFLYDVETNTYYQIVRYSLSVLFIYYTLFLFDKYLAFPKTKVLRFLLLFLSLLAGFAASFYLPEKASHQPFSNNQLTITLQEEVNTESKGREVWIKSINDENGLNLDLNPETLPEGWKVQPENNWYYSTTANKPLSINTNGPISIDFLKHYWSGKVRIEEENSRKTIDLFFAGYESEIYKSNDIQKTDFLTKDLYRAIVFLVFGIITYIVSLLIIHTPLFIIPIIGFFAFAMPNGFFLNVLDNKANVSSFEKKYIPPFDNLSNYNHSTPTVTVPNNRLSIDRIISEGLLNEIIYKSLLFPLISSSKIKMTDLALIEFKDNVYFTDYDFSNSYQYYFYTKETPFIFSEDKPLNGSKSYIFSRPSTDIESNKIDRFDMIVSLPVINLNQNRAFLIKRKTEDGII
ncbi:MAG: hypothetical protein K9N07_11100, partial [Candidatus Cloacimonetes bacterium]|nr:hypothetical protein [Candidatus Cloacimonadota bacterium]